MEGLTLIEAIILALLLSFLLIFSIYFLDYFIKKKRTNKIKKIADEGGFTFHQKGGESTLSRFTSLSLFHRGFLNSKKMNNLLHKEMENNDVLIFDYSYAGYAEANEQTVLSFVSKDLNLPSFSLHPEGTLEKIISGFGYQDIDFDTHPKFSRQYLLRGSDEQAIRNIFSPEVLTFYEKQKGLCTEGNGNLLIYYRLDKRVKLNNINSFLEEGLRVFELFKSPGNV